VQVLSVSMHWWKYRRQVRSPRGVWDLTS